MRGGTAPGRKGRRPSRRRLVAFAATAILFLAAAAAVLVTLLRPRPPARVELRFVHAWTTQAEIGTLESVLKEFAGLNPGLTVIADTRPGLSWQDAWTADRASASFDAAVWYGPYPAGEDAWLEPPTAWSGELWVLAVRRDVLKEMEFRGETTRRDALLKGTLSPEGFEAFLSDLMARGRTPLTLGASHGWPALIWAQHLTVLLGGAAEASALPAIGADGLPRSSAARKAFQTVVDWKKKGFFAAGAWDLGWAEGLQPLVKGAAAMALVSPVLFSAIPPASRGDLEFVPFPGSRTGRAPWSIGLVHSLLVPRSTPHPREAASLVKYLASPGVTRILSARTSRPFFAWTLDTGVSPVVVPSWYGGPPTDRFQDLIDGLRKASSLR